MRELKVSQKNFHTWLVMIKLFQSKQTSKWQYPALDFYKLFFNCWIYDKTEEEIQKLTEEFITNYKLKETLKLKNYFWELSENEQNFSDGMKWAWMYTTIVKEMLPKETKEIKDFINFNFSKEEVEFHLEWSDELFD
jgi:hypothetical protein